MQFHVIILAATEASGSGGLPLLIAVAAVVLAVIALVRVSSLGQELKPTTPAANPQPAPTSAPAAITTAPAPSAAPVSDAIPPEIVAVIAAAVKACTGGNIRIVSIKPTSSSWERAGRQSVLTSHRIR